MDQDFAKMDTLAMAAELKRLREENKRLRLLVPVENQTADRDLFTKKTSHKHKSVRELLEKGEARDSRVSNESWTSCMLLKKATHKSNRRKRKRLPPNLDDTAKDKTPEERGDDGEVGSEINGGDCRIRLVQVSVHPRQLLSQLRERAFLQTSHSDYHFLKFSFSAEEQIRSLCRSICRRLVEG